MRRLAVLLTSVAALTALAACTADVKPPTADDAAATGPRCIAKSTRSPAAGQSSTGPLLPAMALACFDGGRYIDVAELGSEPTIVNLWASWCPPCLEELPVLEQVAAAGHVRVIGIVTKARHDQAQSVIEDARLTFPMLEDQGQQFATAVSPLVDKALFTLPSTLFVAPGGHIVYTYQGPALTSDKVRELTRRYLGVAA